MKILVTGSSGYLGENLINFLSEKKFNISRLTRKNETHNSLKGFSRIRSNNKGDQLVKIQIVTPSKINRKTKKFIWTFSSYDTNDEDFSDRNVMPIGCVLKMTKLAL